MKTLPLIQDQALELLSTEPFWAFRWRFQLQCRFYQDLLDKWAILHQILVVILSCSGQLVSSLKKETISLP